MPELMPANSRLAHLAPDPEFPMLRAWIHHVVGVDRTNGERISARAEMEPLRRGAPAPAGRIVALKMSLGVVGPERKLNPTLVPSAGRMRGPGRARRSVDPN